MVLSKLIYPCTILNFPGYYLKEMNKEFTTFIYAGTLKNVKRTTLAETKQNGGIGLQHIHSRITALRVGYLTEIMKNRNKHLPAHYYFGLKLSTFIRPQNNKPHYFGRSLTPFHASCNKTLANHRNLRAKDTRAAYIEQGQK